MRKVLKSFIFCIIGIYQRLISPLFPMNCRHIPSCSQYAKEAIDAHGIINGGWMSVKRIGRCHPWGSYGFDPVPEQKK
ncbi:MAG TPA: membrane protein insertion efficiency factor YidD [Candidatus Omnitrophota bacterium]|nr:membrane protein insertion efficiency factor YidD [Candidatus Omnitrophota bacterium]